MLKTLVYANAIYNASVHTDTVCKAGRLIWH